jgi:DEAD/DEAH box helicase domain-containing protein
MFSYRLRDQRIIETVKIEMPPYEYTTTGMWINVSKDALHFLDTENVSRAAAIHSASHAFLNQFPLAADLRTECLGVENDSESRIRPAR